MQQFCLNCVKQAKANVSELTKALAQALAIGVLAIAIPLSAKAVFDLSLNYDYYMTKTALKEQLDHYGSLGLDVQHSRYTNKNWFYEVEGVSLFFLDISNQNYLAIPSLFFGYELSDIPVEGYTVNVIFGRHKQSLSVLYDQQTTGDSTSTQANSGVFTPTAQPELWSAMDEIWELGLWQSQVNWDYLLPKPQGLTGLFVTVAKKPWLLTVFGSGLFLPSHDPSVTVTPEGKIHSSSRWFTPPQSNFFLFNQRIETLYWTQTYYLKNILLNDSYAVRLRFGDIHTQWMSVSYAQKPVNQIYFTVDAGLSIKKTAIKNIIAYQLFRHNLMSLDVGIREKYLSIILSATYEQPEQPPVVKNRITPVLPEALFFSSHVRLHPPVGFFLKWLDFNFIYSHFKDPENSFQNDKTKQIKWDIASSRFKMHYGFAVSTYSKDFQWGSQSVSLGLTYWHSIPDAGDRLNIVTQWNITKRLLARGRVDILGSREDTNGFFNTYKHNDRARVEVVYAIN